MTIYLQIQMICAAMDIRTTKIFNVVAALTPELTLWVPGQDGDQAGNDVNISAGGEVTVTVAAEGYEAGSMVTFTKNGTMQWILWRQMTVALLKLDDYDERVRYCDGVRYGWVLAYGSA